MIKILLSNDSTYPVRGVNYYPASYPWRRFLTEVDLTSLQFEFELLREAGLNTLRIFLWNDALFRCPGSGAVPVAEGFMRLDTIMAVAAKNGFRLIVTLNDLPDLENYPLYTNPIHIQQQTAYIIERYRDEPAIFAWDVRNEGDIDYGSNNALPIHQRFSRQQVLDWLAEAVRQVRTLDQNHLLTAGWLHDSESTADYVDFISLHHWWEVNAIESRLMNIRAVSDKPILLEEFGYSTYRVSEDEQAQLIAEGISVVEDQGAAGWMVWAAFDFPLDATCIRPACPSQDNAEHYFGLWRTDYTPKPAADILINRFGDR